jgi:uncharacterized protein (TIGR03067 family)
MRLTHVRFAVWWMTGAFLALSGVTADEPKASEGAAVKQLQGVWRPESVTVDGKKQEGIDLDTFKGITLTIGRNRSILKAAADAPISTYEMTFDASKDPKTFDAKEVEGLAVGSIYKGIWKVEGDTLLWCFSLKDRPKRFESKEGTDVTLMVQKRQKPK